MVIDVGGKIFRLIILIHTMILDFMDFTNFTNLINFFYFIGDLYAEYPCLSRA